MSEHEYKIGIDATGIPQAGLSNGVSGDSAKWIEDLDSGWYRRWQFWGATLAAPTAVTIAAGVAEFAYVDGAVAAVELVMAVGAAAVAGKSFASKWPSHLSWGGVAAAAASSQALATTVAPPLVAVVAWAVASSGAVAARLVYRFNTRDDRFKHHEQYAKAATAMIKQQMAQQKLELMKPTAPESGPDLIGSTPEESAIRRAVWDVFKVSLLGCNVTPTLTGWNARVSLPVGLGRDKARNGWDAVNSALMLGGRFILSDGSFTNELSVKFIDAGRKSGVDATWNMNHLSQDPKTMSLGINTETGEPVLVHADERTLICGASGSGKSWGSRAIMAHAHIHGDLVLIDGKGEEGTVWSHVARVVIEAEDILAMIDELHAEMNDRRDAMRDAGLSVWAGSQLTAVVDEGQVVLALIAAEKEEAKARLQKLRELSSLGRSRGVVLWWATQKPVMSGQAPGIDNLIAPNMLQRFSLRVADEQEARTALDDCAHYAPNLIPDDKSMRGHGYLKGFGPTMIQAWTMDDEAVKSLPRKVWGSKTPQGATTDADKVTRYFLANPGGSNVGAARELGFSETKVRRLRKAASGDDPWAGKDTAGPDDDGVS